MLSSGSCYLSIVLKWCPIGNCFVTPWVEPVHCEEGCKVGLHCKRCYLLLFRQSTVINPSSTQTVITGYVWAVEMFVFSEILCLLEFSSSKLYKHINNVFILLFQMSSYFSPKKLRQQLLNCLLCDDGVCIRYKLPLIQFSRTCRQSNQRFHFCQTDTLLNIMLQHGVFVLDNNRLPDYSVVQLGITQLSML